MKMLSLLGAFMIVGCDLATLGPAESADLSPSTHAVRTHESFGACGHCGRLRVKYVVHRSLRSTYGAGFDPRNFDEAEPYYYPGARRRYVRYYSD